METLFGYAGRLLYVDLTTGRIEKERLNPKDAELYLGGIGINTKLACQLIALGIDPLSPKNVLIYGAGPLVGTLVSGAARTVVVAKSPMTGLFGTSAAGHFGPMMKFAGYDHIVITGRAERPVYLKIFDDEVSLEDAAHLWGKDIYETTDTLWRDYPKAWVSCIGQAGENLVAYAVIINNKYSTYGTTGLGAVMGSKNLKAIVAYGTKEIKVADPPNFMKCADKVHKELMKAPYLQEWRDLGTLIQYQDFAPGATERMRQQSFDMVGWTDIYLGKLRRGLITCPSCPVGCKAVLEIREGKYAGTDIPMSCPAGTLTLPFAQFFRIPFSQHYEIAKCAELANRYGLSTVEFPAMVGFAARLYEEGVITKEETEGLEIKDNDPHTIQTLMRLVAYRQGFGDVLAGRYEEVCRRIGKGAERYIVYTRGLITGIDSGVTNDGVRQWNYPHAGITAGPVKWTATSFGSIISPRGPQPNPYSSLTMMPGRSPQSLRRYCERIGVPPSEMDTILTGEVDGYDVPLLTKYVELYNSVLYSLGSCQRPYISRVLDIDTCAQLYTTATGIQTDAQELMKVGERIINLQRLFNLREGLRKADDVYPEGFLSEAQQAELVGMLEKYYESHGWDKDTGRPSLAKLADLGLLEFAEASLS